MMNWDPSMSTSSCFRCGCCVEGWETACDDCAQYHDYVKEVFVENQMNYGQDEQEAKDAFSSQPFSSVENWLIKSGFDLENDFKYISGK